jgi:hypothetical protein
MNRAGNYVVGSLLYGFVRGVYYTDNVKSHEGERMLFGTRILNVMMCTGMAPVFAPYYLILDMDNMDAKYVSKKSSPQKTCVFPFSEGYRWTVRTL